MLREVLMSVAPKGLENGHVTTMMCGSCSNENSFKMMYFKYMEKMHCHRCIQIEFGQAHFIDIVNAL